MANSTGDFVNKLKSKLQLLEKNIPLKIAVTDVHVLMVKRIFEDGKNKENVKIGDYSINTMLASKQQFLKTSKFKQTKISYTKIVKKKSGKGFKASGKVIRPLWIKFKKAKKAVPIQIIEGGYKEFRGLNGLENSFVNLKFRGLLFRDFAASLTRESANKYLTGLKNRKNVGKLEGNEDRFGNNIFKLTKFEKSELVRIITVERLRIGI